VPFDRLGLIPPLLRALEREGYTRPTPIQEKAIGPVLAGRDLLGCAQTGTGKTAAFALPILQRLADHKPQGTGRRPIRALVLTPTRELATQVAESFRNYGHHLQLSVTEIFGGVSERPQVDSLRRGTDIVVACPGRLLDLMGQGHVRLNGVEVLILDEADRMLDMGFIVPIRRIVQQVPSKRQTLLFSATMPREIIDLARSLLANPVEVSVAPEKVTAELIDQSVFHVAKANKMALLQHLLLDGGVTRALVFTRTKHGADRVAKALGKARVPAEAIHGNKSQNARNRALANFKAGDTRVLVASDIAARGLDIDAVSHVINYDLPNEPETYVHRIGRTGRAGAAGQAFSFCDRDERDYLRSIERLMGLKVGVAEHPYGSAAPAGPAPASERLPRQQQQQRRDSAGGRGGHERRRGDRSDPRPGGHGGRPQFGGDRRPAPARPAPARPAHGGFDGGRDDRRAPRDGGWAQPAASPRWGDRDRAGGGGGGGGGGYGGGRGRGRGR
jgi:ATP-dependent RNA helicase RhlE